MVLRIYYVHCEQIRTLRVWFQEWLSAVWSLCFFRKTSSMRAIGGRSIPWRVVEYGDSWERIGGEGVYLEGFCRSRARVGVSNRIRDPGSSYCKRCRQEFVILLKVFQDMIFGGAWPLVVRGLTCLALIQLTSEIIANYLPRVANYVVGSNWDSLRF